VKIKTLARLSAGMLAVSCAVPAMAQHAKIGDYGLDLAGGDRSVKPGDDFWSYANGNWDRTTTFPADKNWIGSVITLRDNAEDNVRAILDDMAANPSKYGATGQQVGDFYASWMDQSALNAKGAAPLKPYLDRIAAVHDLDGLQVLFASTGYAGPVDLGIMPDLADPRRYTMVTGQSGLGMPRDYYLLPGAKFDAFRTAYRAYIQHIQEIAGVPNAAAKADAIFALETAMAKEQWSPEQMRDIARLNDPETLAGLKAKAPEFNWPLMLATFGEANPSTVLMTTNTSVSAMGKLLVATPLQTWKDYLAYHFVSEHATYLSEAFDDAHFAFYGSTLSGTPAQRERWRRGVALTNGALGEAVGQLYVARFYPPAAEARMAELIENLRAAYQDRITHSAWMDDTTRQAALAKLAAFEPRTGHPIKYIDYSSMKVVRGDLLGNVIRAQEFQHQLELSRFPKPVDKTLWSMTPQTVNAYYSPLANQITFPAAMLQPPYFDPYADAAVNYGAEGAVIGHEMGHGFDDQGSKFGPSGKFENWWSPTARTAFETRTAALAQQYNAYEPVAGTHINGKLTLGENIGDLGGIEAAYAAFQRYQAVHGKAPVIGGLTGDQRFFIAYAEAYRGKVRDDELRQRLLTDGQVRNVDAWYTAFGIEPGDKLYLAPDQRVHIW
jgi:putative endopeptidase